MKNNDKIWRLTRIALTIGVILVAIAGAYYTLREQVTTNSGRIENVEGKSETNQTNITKMQKDITYIKEAVDEIKEQLK